MYVHTNRFVHSPAGVMVGLAIMVFVPGCKTGSTNVGAERGACYPNETCNAGLVCMSDLCVKNVVPGVKNVVPRGMVLIPAGSFWMGCNVVERGCIDGEGPYHEVMLSAYYMDRTEVTVNKYAECVTAGECTAPKTNVYCNWEESGKGNHPVNCVDWSQADTFCKWASKRLPTEAEWEKAARGTDGRSYPWGNEPATCEYAVMLGDDEPGCDRDETWGVCAKSPVGDSPYGLCDMSGNVFEWVSDWYDGDYYSSSPASDPTGPVSGSGRVSRGGSFVHSVGLRASFRNHYIPSEAQKGLGFRCARDAL